MGVSRKIVCFDCKEECNLDKSLIGMDIEKFSETRNLFQELINEGFVLTNNKGYGNPDSLGYELFYSMNALLFFITHKNCNLEVVSDMNDSYYNIKYKETSLKWKNMEDN